MHNVNIMKLPLYFVLLGFVSLVSSGCTRLAAGVANLPTHFSAMERRADIAYGVQPQQKLDVYLPDAAKDGVQRPVVVFIHGGRWSSGSKDIYRFFAARLTAAGYIVVIPDFAKYPAVKFQGMMDDAALAAVWTANNIAAYGGDASRLFLMGHSSGAHMGAVLISDAQYLKKYSRTPALFRGFAGFAGPYAFVPEEPDLKDIFGSPEGDARMFVPNFITGKEPPMLLSYGASDTTVGLFNLTLLEQAIKAKGGAVETALYPNVAHISIISDFAWIGGDSPVVKDALSFLKRNEAN